MANIARTILGDSHRERYPDNYRSGNRAPGAGSDAYWQQVAHKDHWRSKEAHGAFDEFGFTEFMPDENAGPYAQHEANRIAANRNARLGREAGAALYGGLHNLQSYRPGGAAALASGMYGQQAATLLSMRQAAPDLMTMWRKVEADRARKDAKRAQMLSTGIQAAAALGAAAIPLLGPAAAAAGGIGTAIGGAMQGVGTAIGGYYMGQGAQQQGGAEAAGQPAQGGAAGGDTANPLSLGGTPSASQAVQQQFGGGAPQGTPEAMPSQGAPGAPQGGPGGPAPEGAGAGGQGGAGGPAPAGAGGTGTGGAGGEAGPGVGGDGRQMGAPLPMGGLGTQGAMGFSAPGALNSYAQITGVPQEIAYAQLYREAGLEDGFWPALHARLNQMLGSDYIEASTWDDGGEYV